MAELPPIPPVPPRPPARGAMPPPPPSRGLPPARGPLPPSAIQPAPAARPGPDPEAAKRMSEIENKAQALEQKSQDLERTKSAMEQKLEQMEKLLAEEREKAMLASMRSQEEKTLSLRVESNLREIQEKLRRDQRERELESVRAKLEAQLKDAERKMAHERETWVEALKTQMAKREMEDKGLEERFEARVKEIETRFNQERARLAAKLDEKNREIDELKKQTVLQDESLHAERAMLQTQLEHAKTELDKKMAELLETERRLESASSEVESLRIKILDERERAQHETAHLKVQHDEHQRLKSDHHQLTERLELARRALREREMKMDRMKLALGTFLKERETWIREKEASRDLNARLRESEEAKTKLEMRMQATLEAARRRVNALAESHKEELAGKVKEISQLQYGLQRAEEEKMRSMHEAANMKLERDHLKREIERASEDLSRVRREMESAPAKAMAEARSQLGARIQELESRLDVSGRELNRLTLELEAARRQEETFSAEHHRKSMALEAAQMEAAHQRSAFEKEKAHWAKELEALRRTMEEEVARAYSTSSDEAEGMRRRWEVDMRRKLEDASLRSRQKATAEMARFGEALRMELSAMTARSETLEARIKDLEAALKRQAEQADAEIAEKERVLILRHEEEAKIKKELSLAADQLSQAKASMSRLESELALAQKKFQEAALEAQRESDTLKRRHGEEWEAAVKRHAAELERMKNLFEPQIAELMKKIHQTEESARKEVEKLKAELGDAGQGSMGRFFKWLNSPVGGK